MEISWKQYRASLLTFLLCAFKCIISDIIQTFFLIIRIWILIIKRNSITPLAWFHTYRMKYSDQIIPGLMKHGCSWKRADFEWTHCRNENKVLFLCVHSVELYNSCFISNSVLLHNLPFPISITVWRKQYKCALLLSFSAPTISLTHALIRILRDISRIRELCSLPSLFLKCMIYIMFICCWDCSYLLQPDECWALFSFAFIVFLSGLKNNKWIEQVKPLTNQGNGNQVYLHFFWQLDGVVRHSKVCWR